MKTLLLIGGSMVLGYVAAITHAAFHFTNAVEGAAEDAADLVDMFDQGYDQGYEQGWNHGWNAAIGQRT